MRQVKYQLQTFFLFDYSGVENNLAKMAAKGWQIEKIGTLFWKYRRIEPADLTYSVTYVSNTSDFNPKPTEEQLQLEEYCEVAGWRKVCDWNKMNIYCTDVKNPVPIETDEELRLELIQKSMKKAYLPGNYILLALFILYTLSNGFWLWGSNDGANLANASDLALFVAFTFSLWGIFLQISTLIFYYTWVSKSRKSIENGGACYTSNIYYMFNVVTFYITVGLLLVDVAVLGFCVNSKLVVSFSLYAIAYSLIILGMKVTTSLLRKLGAPKGVNIAVTLLVDVILAIILIGGLSYLTFIGL